MAKETSTPTPGPQPKIHKVIPPLIMGTATFNTQYVSDPHSLPSATIVSRALSLGVRGFDTSPYYGPSESILGEALSHPTVTSLGPRSSYFLVTKAGRVAGDEFDYSPSWIRYSVYRSLERLRTPYLDLVYTHDVEFVSPEEVLAAVRELRRLRDEEDGVVRYVGISGYPVNVLCELAEMILRETGEPLDAVLSYGHYTLQNTTLGTGAVERFKNAGVDVVLNASMLGMGLLTTRGVDTGPISKWHPSPEALRQVCGDLVPIAAAAGERLEVVAIRWALDNWARVGAAMGSAASGLPGGERVGISVMGISSVGELEETWRVFKSVMEGLETAGGDEDDAELESQRKWSRDRRATIQQVVEKMWEVLGEWKDHSWSSPQVGYVNTRKAEDAGVIPDDGVVARREAKRKETTAS